MTHTEAIVGRALRLMFGRYDENTKTGRFVWGHWRRYAERSAYRARAMWGVS